MHVHQKLSQSKIVTAFFDLFYTASAQTKLHLFIIFFTVSVQCYHRMLKCTIFEKIDFTEKRRIVQNLACDSRKKTYGVHCHVQTLNDTTVSIPVCTSDEF